jgi:hypothetical protein
MDGIALQYIFLGNSVLSIAVPHDHELNKRNPPWLGGKKPGLPIPTLFLYF